MKNALRGHGMLDVIHSLSAQRASGRLEISTGMTEGALFFDKGQLVDARVGRLTGFQAINALSSVPDASYNFDPEMRPTAHSSMSANERVLLKDFFGIEVANPDDVDVGWTDEVPPSRVVPLADVEDQQQTSPAEAKSIADYSDDEQSIAEDEVTLVSRNGDVAEPAPLYVSDMPAEEAAAADEPPPVDAVREEPLPAKAVRDLPPPLSYAPTSRSRFTPALFAVLVAALIAVAALALLYRSRKPDSTASVAPTVQTPAPAEAPAQPNTNETTPAVPNIAGNWNVVNTVEQTSYQAYRNMKIGFNMSINQSGKDFTGTGQKISENGRSLPADSRTPIVVKGTIDGDKVEATFSENGAVRQTNGRFVWKIDGRGGLSGTFNSTAARTRGKSAATKAL